MLKYPEFIAEMGRPEARPKLRLSAYSGYALAVAMALLLGIADAEGVVAFEAELAWLIGIKLLTNTAALLGLRFDVLALELAGINVIADALLITAGIYYTGGATSPLFSLYVIEVAVFGLLTNTGLTALAAVVCWSMYMGLGVLVSNGVLPSLPPPEVNIMGGTAVSLSLLIVAASTGYVTVLVMKLRKQRQVVERQRDALVAANRQHSQFMTNVTHELRTPIHGIAGLAEMMEMGIYGPVSHKQQEATANIQSNAAHLLDLIDDLLALARADAGQLTYDPSEVDVSELLKSVMAGTRGILEASGLVGTLSVAPGLPVVATDRKMLSQIVINLLGNAAKFNKVDGSVHVAASLAGEGRVSIAVTDTGIGIAPNDMHRIFSEFEQVDDRLERAYGGFGLGLPLVKRLCDMMGAEILVSSEVGKGSTFTVIVPEKHAPALESVEAA